MADYRGASGFRIGHGRPATLRSREYRNNILLSSVYLCSESIHHCRLWEQQSRRTGVPRPSTFVIYSRARSSNKQPVALVSTLGNLARDGFTEPEGQIVNGFCELRDKRYVIYEFRNIITIVARPEESRFDTKPCLLTLRRQAPKVPLLLFV